MLSCNTAIGAQIVAGTDADLKTLQELSGVPSLDQISAAGGC